MQFHSLLIRLVECLEFGFVGLVNVQLEVPRWRIQEIGVTGSWRSITFETERYILRFLGQFRFLWRALLKCFFLQLYFFFTMILQI